jgi:hypothetical protein
MDLNRKIIVTIILLLIFKVGLVPLFSLPPGDGEMVRIQGNRHTVFSLLSEISRQTSYYFIYDSELIDNNQIIDLKRGEYTIHQLLEKVIPDSSLQVEFKNKYIVIYEPPASSDTISVPLAMNHDGVADSTFLLVKGRIVDSSSGEGLPFASIVLNRRGKGISANEDGFFNFKIPNYFYTDTLKISYLGYSSRYIPVSLMQDVSTEIYMDFESKSLKEVVVASYNPLDILFKTIDAKDRLYPQEPTIHTSFYREGIFKNGEFLQYSEAVFEIYKASYRGSAFDQVKPLKSRNITNNDVPDSIIIKLKAGIQSILELDVVKHPPEFLDPLNLPGFKFPDAGFVNHDSGQAFAITFEPADYITDGIYKGTIYIDRESLAILQVDFGITPSYLVRNQGNFITRRSKLHITRIRSMNYSVRYALHNGNYHIQHVRGEIVMRIREKNKLWGNNYNAFFEMAVMNIETENVKRFSRRETIRPNVIFTDQEFVYDPEFWEDFNFVIPEKRITNAIQNFNVDIENYYDDE